MKISNNKKQSIVRSLPSLLIIFVIVFTSNYIFDFKYILDWDGYEKLLYLDGGWLYDANIDPLFVTLLEFTNYVARDWSLLFLTCFCYFFMILSIAFNFQYCGYNDRRFNDLLFGLVMTCLFLSKFAAQIREGLAISVLLFGLSVCRLEPSRAQRAIAIITLVASSTLHGGLIPIIITALISILFGKRENVHFIRKWQPLIISIFLGAVLATFLNSDVYILYDNVSYALGEVRQLESNDLLRITLSVAFILAHAFLLLYGSNPINKWSDSNVVLSMFFSILGFCIIPMLLALNFILIVFGFDDGTILASIGRILNTCQSLYLLGALYAGCRGAFIFLVSAFIIGNQLRVLSASVDFSRTFLQ